MLYQPPPRQAYSPPHINIDGTNLDAVEFFTYLGSVISNDATVSKNLDKPLVQSQQFHRKTVKESMAESLAPPLHKAHGIQGRRRSHPPVRSKDLGSLSEADQATGAVSPTPLALDPWLQMARPRVERRSPQNSQPAQHRVHFTSGTAALGWPRHKDGRRMHAQSSLLQQAPRRKTQSWSFKKALQKLAEETACTGGNQPSVMVAGGLSPRQLALISEKSHL